MSDRTLELRVILLPFAKQPDSHIHWVDDGDDGLDYCEACAALRVRLLKHRDRLDWRRGGRKRHRREYEVGGGYESYTSDCSAACDRCGKALAYSLTDDGLESEVEHFSTDFDPEAVASNPWAIYEITRILAAAQRTNDAKLAADAIAIGKAVAAILVAQQAGGENA